MSTFTQAFEKKQREIYTVTRANGWWDGERNDGELIALMHSELSEALEALRNGNGSSEKMPGFNAVEEELADAVIRIMDYAAGCNLRLAEAIEAKMVYNAIRPYRHGKAF